MLKLKKLNVQKIREDFPILKKKIRGKPLIYFDNAATTQKPKIVIETIKKFYEDENANVHRGVHTLSYEASILYESAHKKVAKLISANSWDEVIFTRNTSEALNLVAYSLGLWELKEGDEILTTLMEHHSNIVPWLMLKKYKGIKVKFIPVSKDGKLILDDLDKLITDKTKIITCSLVSNFLGTINPVKEIVKEAKKKGAYVVVDGAQAVPHLPVNVKEIGCDFFAASGHKMAGPTGIGFLWAKREILQKMEPFLFGGDMIFEVTTEGALWNELPWKFEAGTPNIAGGIGLGVACDYLSEIGMQNILEHEKELTEHCLLKMQEIPDIELYGPSSEERVGVISFNVRGIHPHDISGMLDEEGIATRSGHHCTQPLMREFGIEGSARASFYIYNTKEEIDIFVDKLKEIVKFFKRE